MYKIYQYYYLYYSTLVLFDTIYLCINLKEDKFLDKETILKEIEKKLKIVNKGILKPEDFDDSQKEELEDYHRMLSGRNDVSPMEQTAILDELSKMRK